MSGIAHSGDGPLEMKGPVLPLEEALRAGEVACSTLFPVASIPSVALTSMPSLPVAAIPGASEVGILTLPIVP